MSRACAIGWTCILAVAFSGNSLTQDKPPRDEPRIEVKVVKYDDLAEVVRRHRGKVIVVDFWATFCVPCIREMPRLVELQEKYSKQGFTAVLVSVDEHAQKPETQAKVNKVLRAQKANVVNLLLDEPAEVWQKKLDTPAVPCIYVFNREGKWVKKYTTGVDYNEIEKLVVELLNQQ